jgi:hypothetical protein
MKIKCIYHNAFLVVYYISKVSAFFKKKYPNSFIVVGNYLNRDYKDNT